MEDKGENKTRLKLLELENKKLRDKLSKLEELNENLSEENIKLKDKVQGNRSEKSLF